MATNMTKIYANRIISSKGAYTLDDVPGYIRDAVREILIDKGYLQTEGTEAGSVDVEDTEGTEVNE